MMKNSKTLQNIHYYFKTIKLALNRLMFNQSLTNNNLII